MFGIVASQNVPQVKRSSICKSGFSNGWQHGNLLNLLSTHYGHAPVLVVAHRFLFNPLFFACLLPTSFMVMGLSLVISCPLYIVLLTSQFPSLVGWSGAACRPAWTPMAKQPGRFSGTCPRLGPTSCHKTELIQSTKKSTQLIQRNEAPTQWKCANSTQ
jgi:hypothetical protein